MGARESTPSPEPRAGTRRETKLSADWPSTCKKIPGALTQRLRNWGPAPLQLVPPSLVHPERYRGAQGRLGRGPGPKSSAWGRGLGRGDLGAGLLTEVGRGTSGGSPIWGLWKPPWGSCVGKALKGVTVPSHKHKHEGAS